MRDEYKSAHGQSGIAGADTGAWAPGQGIPFGGISPMVRELTSIDKAGAEEKHARRCRDMLDQFLQRPTHEAMKEITYLMERYVSLWTDGRVRVL